MPEKRGTVWLAEECQSGAAGGCPSIQPIGLEHVPGLVRLHLACYPTQFATQLGAGFLTVVYCAYCGDPNAVGFVSTSNERAVAAVVGVIGGGFKQRMMRRHWAALLWSAALAVLRRPRLLPQVAARIFAAIAAIAGNRSGRSEGCPRRFVWRSQAVNPGWRGKGMIFPLISALVEALRERGVEEIYSTPDEDNGAAIWIHRVLNFEKRGTKVAWDGKRQAVFVLNLRQELAK